MIKTFKLLGKKSEKPFIIMASILIGILFNNELLAGGLTEFATPLEKVMETITGPAGKFISIIGMAICGLVFIVKNKDIAGGFKLLLGVVFGICFIALAASIVNSIFSFSGAVI